jgi:hypothetical protein
MSKKFNRQRAADNKLMINAEKLYSLNGEQFVPLTTQEKIDLQIALLNMEQLNRPGFAEVVGEDVLNNLFSF